MVDNIEIFINSQLKTKKKEGWMKKNNKWAKAPLNTQVQSRWKPPITQPPEMFDFTGKIDNGVITGFQHVLDNLNKIRILDVRSKEEFSGEIVRAARSGHIPTSTNVDWAENITRDGTLKNNEDLSKLYNLPKDAEIVTYCQGGYRAANTYLALKKIGFTNVMVYLGSWGEWGNMLELPAE